MGRLSCSLGLLAVCALLVTAELAHGQSAPAPAAQAPVAHAPVALAPSANAPSSISSQTPSTGSSAPAPEAEPNSSQTAVSAQLLLKGTDVWPLDSAKQAILASSIKYVLRWATGGGDKLSVIITDSEKSIPRPGSTRHLLQPYNALVTTQLDIGTNMLVKQIRNELEIQVNNGGLAKEMQKEGFTGLTKVDWVFAEYVTPAKAKPDYRPQMAVGFVLAGIIVFSFIFTMIYLEAEKTRSFCGYTPFWWADKRAKAEKPRPALKNGDKTLAQAQRPRLQRTVTPPAPMLLQASKHDPVEMVR